MKKLGKVATLGRSRVASAWHFAKLPTQAVHRTICFEKLHRFLALLFGKLSVFVQGIVFAIGRAIDMIVGHMRGGTRSWSLFSGLRALGLLAGLGSTTTSEGGRGSTAGCEDADAPIALVFLVRAFGAALAFALARLVAVALALARAFAAVVFPRTFDLAVPLAFGDGLAFGLQGLPFFLPAASPWVANKGGSMPETMASICFT